MNKNSVIFTGLLICLCFTFCKKSDLQNNNISKDTAFERMNDVKFTNQSLKVEKIINDRDFINFMLSNLKLLNSAKDLKKSAEILNANKWNELDKNELALYLGFKNAVDLTYFFNQQNKLKIILNKNLILMNLLLLKKYTLKIKWLIITNPILKFKLLIKVIAILMLTIVDKCPWQFLHLRL